MVKIVKNAKKPKYWSKSNITVFFVKFVKDTKAGKCYASDKAFFST